MKMSTFYKWVLINTIVLGVAVGCAAKAQLEPPFTDFYAGHNEHGLQTVEKILEAEPENATALALRGAFNMRLGEVDQVLADADRALELDPQLGLAHAVRASYFLDAEGDFDKAGSEIERALELDPQLAYAYSLQGAVLFEGDGNVEAAMASYQQALKLQPTYWAAHTRLGDVYAQNGDLDSALKEYDRAIEINPQEPYAYISRAYSLLDSGNAEGSLADFNKAIELEAADPYLYLGRALAYSQAGNQEAATADYEKALAIDPEDPYVLNDAAYHFAFNDGDLARAQGFIDKALAAIPDDPYMLDTKAYIHYKLGEYDAALPILIGLIEEQGFTPSYYGRGLVYEAQGENEKAISDLQAFLAEFPEGRESDDARQHLESLGVSAP